MRVVMTGARPTEEDPREHQALTKGERYFVIGVSNHNYRVVDDAGEPILFPKTIFEVVDRSLPAGWSLREFEDGVYRLDPTTVGRRGFYEHWFDSSGDRAATEAAQLELRRTLEAMRSSVDEIDRALLDRDLARLDAAVRRADERRRPT